MFFAAIMDANAGHIARDREQAWRFADAASPPPDEMRVPVSVRALAARLALPVTTTRRRVSLMVEDGICVRTPQGVFIPTVVLQQERALKSGLSIHRWFVQLLNQLADLGYDFSELYI